MRTVRYVLLVLFVLAPALALAQIPDSVHVEIKGTQYPGYGAAFGERFPPDTNLGPFPLTLAQGTGETAPPAQGCDPFVNADQVEGSVVFIERGTCTFVQKVLNAQEAGAEVVVVFNGDLVPDDDNSLVLMGGECPPSECTIPAAFISRAAGLAIVEQGGPFNPMATIIPIRVMNPCFGDPIIFSTGVVRTFVFNDGFIGDYPGSDGCFWNFDFMGEEGLRIASVLVGQVVGSDTVVTGSPYVSSSEYETLYGDDPVYPPFPPPFEDFDHALDASFGSPLGVDIKEVAYARYGDAFIVFDLNLTNSTDTPLTDVYVGLFADWDVGDAGQNLGGFDEGTNLLYVFDASGTSPSYFGVAALGADASGWTLATDEEASDSSLYEGLTTTGTSLPMPQDARTVLGLGPFDLIPGDTVNARFAMVAGTGEADIVANAQAAQEAVVVAAEETAPEGEYVLASAYPNPFVDRTTISFALPTAQHIRLVVYDVLGREVAVLADGARPAGAQAVDFDASALPSGVYLVRLEAGAVQLVERVTVVR